MNNAILSAIKSNISANGMTFVSYMGVGDGSKVFNKGRGANAMLEVMGHAHTDIRVETTNTVLVGGNYEDMMNNRIKKAVKKLLTEVQLAGGDNGLVEGMLEGIVRKIENPEIDPDTGKEIKAFNAQSLPYGEWVEGWEGILIEHKGEIYLRVYDETNAKSIKKYFLNGETFDIENPKYTQWKKAPRKKSGKVNELNEALSKVLDLENPDIKKALDNLKPLRPQVVNISNMENFTVNGQTFTK